MSIESFRPTASTLGGGFFAGILIGYALKKVIKMVAVIVGLFLAGLSYLQYHQIANIN
ncbi:MAG: FUN14 domain-containing protein [Nitrososphaeraceae archaeon]